MTGQDFVLSVIAGFGSQVHGRTLLQKRAYFVDRLSDTSTNLGYDAHFYGPYSAMVDNSVARLKSLGFLAEENTGFGVAASGFEIKRYDYSITFDGQRILDSIKRTDEFANIARACELIVNAGDPNYFVLSIAAKADFILGKRGKAMTRLEIIREAEKFDWHIQGDDLSKAVEFLENVGLIQAAQERAS